MRKARRIRVNTNNEMKMKNTVCATPADADGMRPNPKMAATMETTRKTAAQYSMVASCV